MEAHTAWMAIPSLNLDSHPTHLRSVMERFQKHSLHYVITTEFCRCNKSCVFANSETETCLES